MVTPMRNLLLSLALVATTVSCAGDYADAPTKLVGVGYNPDEIGPAPTPYGGVVEYSWVNFAGGGLNLALMGLGSFDEVGPNLVGFAPPYSAVYGFSYVFDTKLSAADSLAGVTSVPPDVDDTCYTTFSAGGPIGSFKTVDVGSWMEFRTTNEARDGGFRMERTPRDYPSNAQDLFVYYLGFDYYQGVARYGRESTGDGTRVTSLDEVLVQKANFPFGQEVEYSFPGAVAGQEQPIASLPRPSAAVDGGDKRFNLPNAPGGVQLAWNGPAYDSFGREVGSGAQSTCLSFAAPSEAPVDAAACGTVPSGDSGQIYTGPWSTEEGVTFNWTPSAEGGETVSLAVRFLGPVDQDDAAFKERVVLVQPDAAAQRAWSAAQRDGDIPSDATIPVGRRAPQACEDPSKVTAEFDDQFSRADGELVPALRGDPFNNVAEVTCRLKDDGSYTLTSAQLEQAMTYAKRMGAQGAIFYFARSTEVDAAVPPVKGQFGQRLDISPIKLTSRAVDIGRFWYEE